MKKILSLLGTITLIGISTTSLVACNKTQYTEDELKKEKEKHKIDTKDQNIRDNLEWIVPQDKPFNEADNRWYFIIWKADKWIATKYKNNRYEPSVGWIIEDLHGGKYRLMMRPNVTFGAFSDGRWRQWDRDDGSYFKAVYRWNLTTPEPDLIVDSDGNIKVN
ncbi:lipoprotein [Spiroplasma endosymbiont of Sarcophaga variegata]|uniref:lipoprotein n=1 Tax=Spiroplasma endosymbiont of Sarcophaga variegata TaxID=3066304 RepID=UPI003AF664CA